MSAVLTFLFVVSLQQLGQRNITQITDKLTQIRKEELKHYTQIAMSAVEHARKHSHHGEFDAQEMAREIFGDLSYGDDGYFFVYDHNGNVIVHPQKRYLEGQNMWGLRDSNGVYVIRSLVREGMKPMGGYTQYVWEKPSSAREVDKLSFSIGLNDWDWMVATGLYIDDVEVLANSLEQEIDSNTKRITLITIAVALLFTMVIAFIAIRLTMLHCRFANHKLQKISNALMHEREVMQHQLSSYLYEKVIKHVELVSKKYLKLMRVKTLTNEEEVVSKHILSELKSLETHTRHVADELSPKLLRDEGLQVAVSALAERLASENSVEITTTSFNIQQRLPLDIETVCYRMTQQALENVIMHAQATAVSVRLRQSRSMLTMTVQDNGVGFDLRQWDKQHHNGSGLLIMEMYAEWLGGTLTVFSSEGTGTIIKVAIPLSKDILERRILSESN